MLISAAHDNLDRQLMVTRLALISATFGLSKIGWGIISILTLLLLEYSRI